MVEKVQGSRSSGAPRRGASVLSRDQVLDAAMEILQAEGADRVTVRGLAGKLGVAVTAIYWHVGDKQALLDALVDRVIAQMAPVAVAGRGPEARIVSIGTALRTSLLEQADLVGFVHRQGRSAVLFQPARRVLVRELTRADLAADDAARAVQAILNLVVGSVLVDRQVERQPVQRQSATELWTEDDVPDAELLAQLTAPVDEEEIFDYSLRVLVRAVVGPNRTATRTGPRRAGR
jgi:TetR/AcrR family tetracycline transcriptional repressor